MMRDDACWVSTEQSAVRFAIDFPKNIILKDILSFHVIDLYTDLQREFLIKSQKKQKRKKHNEQTNSTRSC